MKRAFFILLVSCILGELVISMVHQFILQAPYSRLYLLIPLFFTGVEGIYYTIEQYARNHTNQAKAVQVYMFYKTGKLLLTLALVLGLAFFLPEVGVAFFLRLLAMYLITLVVETKLAMAWMLKKTNKSQE
jgi:hypothetical protein